MATRNPKPASFLGKIIAQLLGWLVCIVVPGFVTAMAPVSWVTYQRQGDHVTARAEVCLFFIIPYRTVTVDPVIGFGRDTHEGSVTRHRKTGRPDTYIQAENQGFLVINGVETEVRVSVTPFNLDSIIEKSEAFLKDPQSTKLRLFVVANWKFSVLGGALVTSLTVIYLGSCVFVLGQMVLRALGLVKREAPEQGVVKKSRLP